MVTLGRMSVEWMMEVMYKLYMTEVLGLHICTGTLVLQRRS